MLALHECALSPAACNLLEAIDRISVQVDADLWGTAKFVDSVRLPYIAPSLGGVDSLIEQPTVISYWDQVRFPAISAPLAAGPRYKLLNTCVHACMYVIC